jgi:probable rRNA maturation factor
VIIHVTNSQRDLKISIRSAKALVNAVLASQGIACEEVGIHFVTKRRISALHQDHFNDPTPTDCITFPIDADYLGDVFICPSVAIEYAQKRGLDPIQETMLYTVHGLLHLLGYDDLSLNEKRSMRKKEKECMAYLLEMNIRL